MTIMTLYTNDQALKRLFCKYEISYNRSNCLNNIHTGGLTTFIALVNTKD